MSKRFDIFAFICAFRVDILAVTETFLDGTISDGEICPGHYRIYRRDRSRHGGGVLVIIREDIRAFLRDDLNFFCDELLFLEVSTTCGPMLFGVFYRPPAQGANELIALSKCLLSYPVGLCSYRLAVAATTGRRRLAAAADVVVAAAAWWWRTED